MASRETPAIPGSLASLTVTPLPVIQHRQQKMLICRYFKPSDGLEPSTPSLPWRCSTN